VTELQGKIRVSSAAAVFLKGDAPRDLKLKAAGGQVTLPASDLAVVLFFLCHEQDVEIRDKARHTVRDLPGGVVLGIVGRPDLHYRLVGFFAHLHGHIPEVAEALALHPAADQETLTFLAERGVAVAAQRLAELSAASTPSLLLEESSEDEGETSEETVDEENEEFKSKFKLAQTMGVADKIKMAITGDKEWRSIFLKDANKMVSGSAIKNPRITDSEIVSILKSPIQNDEIMRVICSNKEWTKNYNIRKALVENSRTPLPHALKLLTTLNDKDVASLAKSKNITSVLSNQAKRIIASKKK
jgi:hypothetical protein